MTQKDINELTVFLGNNDAFISKFNKDGKISKVRRALTEDEIMNFFVWCVKSKFRNLGSSDFTINVNGSPTYKITNLTANNTSNIKVEEIVEG